MLKANTGRILLDTILEGVHWKVLSLRRGVRISGVGRNFCFVYRIPVDTMNPGKLSKADITKLLNPVPAEVLSAIPEVSLVGPSLVEAKI